MNNSWHLKFLQMADMIALWSKDPSSKVGCVIVDDEKTIRATGYNGIPRDVRDDVLERHERPTKYLWYNHAEANAIANCARTGVRTENCTIFVTHPPCSACTRSIIQAGIANIVVNSASFTPDFMSRWKEEFETSQIMLDEAKIKLIIV